MIELDGDIRNLYISYTMNIDSVRVFYEVARQESFTRAARLLQLTQPAASMAVQSLESEIGCDLIDRRHRPPRLTPAGRIFFAASRDILTRLEQAQAQIQSLEKDIAGPVRVASIYSVGLYYNDVVLRFMEMFPKATIRLQYLRPNLVVEAVLKGDAVLGLVSFPRETRELAVIPWHDQKMVLVCPPGHRLASTESVSMKELDGEDFIAFDRDLIIREKVDAAINRHAADVRVVSEFDNIETMKQAVQVGSGITILPEATIQKEVKAGSLIAIQFTDEELVRPIAVIYRREKVLSPAAAKFVEILAGACPLDFSPRMEQVTGKKNRGKRKGSTDELTEVPATLAAVHHDDEISD